MKIKTLPAAAKAAGCTLSNPPVLSALHEEREFTKDDYNSNPPTSGKHFPEWYPDGIYAPGTTPNLGMLVHTLEHGRIDLQYKPGTPAATVVAARDARRRARQRLPHAALRERAPRCRTRSPRPPGATCSAAPTMNDKVFDAVRAFWKNYVDKGPEIIP